MFFYRKKPVVVEVALHGQYKFMYENCLFSTQQELYVLLDASADLVRALKFKSLLYKYGYPNDEVLGAHPMAKFGLDFYGLFEVKNSPWVTEIIKGNRRHHRHSDKMFSNVRHYILTFKDVTLDVLSSDMEEISIPREKVLMIVNEQLNFLTDTG
jgi:hypothetical protein